MVTLQHRRLQVAIECESAIWGLLGGLGQNHSTSINTGTSHLGFVWGWGRDHSTYIITGVGHFVFFKGVGRDHSTHIITGISHVKFVWGVGRDHSTCITVGSEATNPGHHRYHQSKWSLGKAPMYDTILGESTDPVNSGIAESHLTHHGLQRFRQEFTNGRLPTELQHHPLVT